MSSSWYCKIFKPHLGFKTEAQPSRHRMLEEDLQALENLPQTSGPPPCWENDDQILHSEPNTFRNTLAIPSIMTGASQTSDPNSSRPSTRSLSLRLSLERVPSRMQPDEDAVSPAFRMGSCSDDEGDLCRVDCWNGNWRGVKSSNEEAVHSYDTRSLCERRVRMHVLRLCAQF